jgi:hypothetical protein
MFIAIGAVLLIGGGYWLYTNDKLGPLSPSQESDEVQVEPPSKAPEVESAPISDPDTIRVLTPEEIPDDIPYEEPTPATAG